ncbi:MAG: pyridoxal phosphate-dependent aminotransferase [Labilithrix sp.]|nr:pyridoxal phosphate-dependent aminotransferase [Labilithrix sp.]
MPFSRRTRVSELAVPGAEATNALSRAVAAARAVASSGGRPLFDLTVSNPTTAELPYDAEAIARALATPRALVYEPEALGLASARGAVASLYAERGIAIAPSRVAVTSSTSEAYAVLFKTFCDPGDEVLVPTPSYPLLAWLAAFEGVTLKTYPLEYAGHWHVDVGALARAVGPRTRLVVVVSPNNPTGSFLGEDELDAILDLGLPIASDEVFATYPLTASGRAPAHRVDSALRAERGLVFALSGLSKLAGLPQMKLGWIACGGDPTRAGDALERLETVLDAYLSVGAPVQHALPELLRAGRTTSDAIRARTRSNLAVVREAAQRAPSMSVLDVEGGWYATLRVPETRSDEEWALALVAEDGVYVHPGYFFDMTRGAHLVVSLLTPEAQLREGMARLSARLGRDD